MVPDRALHTGLRDCLKAAVSGAYSHQQLNHLVRVAHALSSAFLAGKRSAGLLIHRQGVSLSDLAYDCIAEIFQRSHEGRLVQLDAYFCSVVMGECDDEEILAHFRRLVFSKVNQGVFRLYGEIEPALSKILRNTKLAVASLGQFAEVERFGEPCITPAMCDPLGHLPPPQRSQLEDHLSSVSRGNESVPTMLSHVSLYLREQEVHSRIVPVAMIAYAFRNVYHAKMQCDLDSAGPASDHTILADDVHRILNEVCSCVEERFRKKYVGRKMQPELFSCYLEAVRAALVGRFIHDDGSDISLYDRLKTQIRDLTKEDYKKFHKARLEYLSRQAHDLAVARLRGEMQ